MSDMDQERILHHLLNVPISEYNDNAVRNAVMRDPRAAKQKYYFYSSDGPSYEDAPVYPLFAVLYFEPSVEVMKLLYYACPAAVKARDSCGSTPLHCACENGAELDIIRFLYRKYPDAIREKDQDGMTPLQLACAKGAPPEVIQFILNKYPEAAVDIMKENEDMALNNPPWWVGACLCA